MRLQYPKFWLRGGQRLKLHHDLDGDFGFGFRNDGTVNSYTMRTIKERLQSLSLMLSEDHKRSIFDNFFFEASEPTLVAVVAIVKS